MKQRLSLNEHLYTHGKINDALRHLILHIATAAKYVHSAIRTTEAGLAGSRNLSGDDQIKLDVLSNDIIEQHLRESHLVATYISEEKQDVIELQSKAPYSVVFDPLDGSSLADVNFAIGSIFGIYEGDEILGRKPKEQVAALYTIYGPRTLLVYATRNGVHEFILNEVGEFMELRQFVGVADIAKTYSPGNLLGLMNEDARSKAVMDAWLGDKMNLRYSGCMVADVHHIFSKGQGVFAYAASKKNPEGKLRLVFECGPFAHLMQQAGGSASDGKQSILEKTITDIDQRTPIIIGSTKEVERVSSLLNS